MSTMRRIFLLCLLLINVFHINAKAKKPKNYNANDYFFNTKYTCFKGASGPHLRRCRLNYVSNDFFSIKCIHCPLACSFCAKPVDNYGFDQVARAEQYYCHFHSLHVIDPIKIKSRKGVTEKGDVKCRIKNFCNKKPCKNQGTCVNLYHSYTCICPKEYHGKECASKSDAPGKLTYGVQLWFPLEVTAARLFPFLVTVAYEGENQIIELSTKTGYTIRLKASDKIKDFSKKCGKSNCRCDTKGCKTVYKGTLIADTFYLKQRFDDLPILIAKSLAVGFVTKITIKVYNGQTKAFEDTINSFTKLRLQEFYPNSELQPNSLCSVQAEKQRMEYKYCSGRFDSKPTIKQNTPAVFRFTPKYVFAIWNMFKRAENDNVMGVQKDKQSDIPSCSTGFSMKYYWRIYNVDEAHKLTDSKEASGALEKAKCSGKKNDKNTKCSVNLSKVKPGDYVVRLTLQTYQQNKIDGKLHYSENYQTNLYCYFNLQGAKTTFDIKGGAVVNSNCEVVIDTEGYNKEGSLIWTCTAKKGGPCPEKVAINNTPYLDKVKFPEGNYEVCVDWKDAHGNSVGRPCVTFETKDCDDPNKPSKPDYAIDCKENCDPNPNPNRPMRLGVIDRFSKKSPDNVTWILTDPNGDVVPNKDFTINKGSRKNEIKIDLQKLTPKKHYKLVAKVGDAVTTPRDIFYTIADIPKGGNCTMNPLEGMRGVTLFDIECFGWQAEGPILYEFFDKKPEEVVHYEGRMISYSYSGILTKFRLTRGKVAIYLLNEDGDGPIVNITATLTDFNNNISHIDYLMNEMDTYMEYENYQPSMDIMSTASEILDEGMNNEYYLAKILSTMNKVKHNSAESMKLGLSTMLSILNNGTLKGKYLLNDVLEMYTGKIHLDIATNYLKYATQPGHVPRFRSAHILQLSRNMMDSVDMTIIAQDKNVSKLEPEEDINYDVMDNLNMASNDNSEAVMIAMYLVGRFQVYDDPGTEIQSSQSVTDLRVYVNEAEGLVGITGSNLSSYVNISEELASSFDPNHDIMLQFALMKKNMFWWAQNNVNTEVMMVGLAEKLYRPGYYFVPTFSSPVSIFMKVKDLVKTTVSGTATQLDPELGTDTLDRIVLVHRFILPPLSKLFIKFNLGQATPNADNSTSGNSTLDDSSAASSLRVHVAFNERPTWESLSNASVISPENPDVDMPYDTVEREHFYYMGILPDPNVPVNETVDYSFDVYFVNCHIWENQWVNHYCEVGLMTTEETIECRCTHMSVFSSTIFIPPNDINPVLDAPLFLTVYENPWVVIFVLIVLLLFLLLLLWAFLKDKKDALCTDVIVLHDNYPGESYAYLIAIFTGARVTSGTSAVVGLRLYGDTFASRPTILKCDTRKVLQRDNDDWFLLCYPVSIGMVNAVQMWHNNKGRSPDWYCSKVIVYDLQAKTQYLFIVDQWLAMEVDEFPEALVRPATSDEVLSVKRIFQDNSVLGLRENHLHLSIFTRHPRSHVARKQRLVVLMVLIMSAMLASIMFFKVSDAYDETVDEYHYSFREREIIISIQTFIISSVIAFIALLLFRKSYKQKEVHKHHNTLFMPRKRSSVTNFWISGKPEYVDLSTFIAFDEKPVKQRKDMSMFESFVKAIRNCTHQKNLRSVTLASEESEIEVKRGWLIAAWVFSILVIIISAYLVMLYSLKFGKIKSLKWLSSLVASQLQDIFLFTPLKILIVAMLLSIAFERSTDVPTFKLDVNKAIKQDLVGNKAYLRNLVEKRKDPIYYPMSDEVKAKKRRKTMRKVKWRIILDFFSVLTFLLILCYVMRQLWSGAHFHPNQHATDMLMTTYHGRFVALEDIYNRTQFFAYMQHTFVRSMFEFRWFGDLNFKTLSPPEVTERKDWTKDFVSKMVGAPRLRQLRVIPGKCPVHQMMVVTIKECNYPWRPRYMDTDTYGVQWAKAQLEDEQAYAWGHRTNWMYNNPKNTSVFPRAGKSGVVYPSGGYIMPLAVKRELSKSYTIQIEEEHWIDEHTRAVFLELTLYNVNNNLFSQVTATVEQTTSGLYLTLANVDSVHTREDWSTMNAIYIIFMIALLIKIIYNVNRHGLINFFKRLLNVYELLVIIVGTLSIVYYLIHVKVSTFYVEEFHREGEDRFFNFTDMIKYFLYAKVFMWVLFCLLVFRLFVSWYFGRAYVDFYHTFVLSKRYIVILMLLVLFNFWLIWRFIGYTIDALIFYNYRVNILHNKMYTTIYRTKFQVRTKYLALILCFLMLFFKTIFFVVFTHAYKIGKRKRLSPMQYFNILNFYVHEFKRGLGKKSEEIPISDRQIHRKRDINMPKNSSVR